jgi:hypothetical protein
MTEDERARGEGFFEIIIGPAMSMLVSGDFSCW